MFVAYLFAAAIHLVCHFVYIGNYKKVEHIFKREVNIHETDNIANVIARSYKNPVGWSFVLEVGIDLMSNSYVSHRLVVVLRYLYVDLRNSLTRPPHFDLRHSPMKL